MNFQLNTRMGDFNEEERSILSENISKIVNFLNNELETDLIAELQEWLKGQGTVQSYSMIESRGDNPEITKINP